MCDGRPMELKDTVEKSVSKQNIVRQKFDMVNSSVCWKNGMKTSSNLLQHVREAPMIFRLLR